MRRGWGTATVRAAIVLLMAIYFLVPLYSMLEFSTRGIQGRTAYAWKAIWTDPDVVQGVTVSLELAAITVALVLVLLVSTITWVHLRAPRTQRLVEFLCLLPLTIPAIAMIVGVAAVYDWVYKIFGGSALTLAFVYAILALPFAYRSIEAGFGAIDARTLAEAARTLGYSWPAIILRVLVPNLRTAIISGAVITVALVMGEFTIASLLSFNTLQVAINVLGKRDAEISVAVSLAVLLIGFVLLLLITLLGRRPSPMPLAMEEDS